ncbi:MAG: glucose-1-phosphate thymidylyltransferase [Chitinophagaceae bacterium]|nr:glucose-1-phosphate thymidylyltransferase [Chitinophagaceae bacterium]
MKIILDDINVKDQLYPFTAIKSAADIRIGINTIKEKWEKLLHCPVLLQSEVNNLDKAGITIPANIIPAKESVEAVLKEGIHAFLKSNATRMLNHPMDIFKHNAWAIQQDFNFVTLDKTSQPVCATNILINPSQIFIEQGAIVEHSILNATHGPVYIGKNVEIMEGCMIRGPFAICEGAVVKMGAKIYGATTIGPYCVAAGEIKNSVIFGYSNKAHDGYLGDSVIGEWCNLGAGTSNSNIKNTAGTVKVWNNVEKKLSETTHKCGLLMGDYSRAGINTSFNTGTTIGICCNIFGESYPPKYVPDFSWGNEQYQLEKAFNDINNWKQLKEKSITEQEKEILTILFNKK